MENQIAVLAIVVHDPSAAQEVNAKLHDFREHIVGRLGLPQREKKISVISVILDAPQETINSLSGKIGMINGVTSKVLITK